MTQQEDNEKFLEGLKEDDAARARVRAVSAQAMVAYGKMPLVRVVQNDRPAGKISLKDIAKFKGRS